MTTATAMDWPRLRRRPRTSQASSAVNTCPAAAAMMAAAAAPQIARPTQLNT
eukprot:CAMPEP_0206151152 /NCGR_PEP_ID=MMETSP1473-20131121/38674_1 /ASSEMBLY_ACC=CAM_ASM_001109 /TAXON_ID=1461547 /ORGANISM="Stichococcus sp, Strain RCC1054" /LENGTH=51 /DNA_ID=CAMNT_0053548689 /DNA_START=383 /DNA_END=538 /DNA_ORIENTATION=-